MSTEGALLADRLRARAPEFAWVELSDSSLRSIGESADPRIEIDEIAGLGQPYVLTLPLAGRRVLVFEPWVPRAVRVYVCVRESVLGWRAGKPPSLRSAEVASLAAVLHAAGCAEGAIWQESRLDELRDCVAFSAPLSELLMEVRDAAAFLCPQSVDADHRKHAGEEAKKIYRSARELRMSGDYAAALEGFDQAATSAEFGEEYELLVWCHIGKAYVHRALGSITAARETLATAVDLVDRHDVRGMRCSVHHDQFSVAVECSDISGALAAGRDAIETYPPNHPRVPCFAHDIADFLASIGAHAAALPVIRAVLDLPGLPLADCIIGRGTLARAAGAVGDAPTLETAKAELLRLMMRSPGQEFVARAMLDVATGEASLGRVELSAETAERALCIAIDRAEAGVAAELRVLLRRLSGSTAPSRRPTPVHDAARRQLAEALAAEALTLLSARRAATAA
jgi:tetratricopeptide (TPR) repeat protein